MASEFPPRRGGSASSSPSSWASAVGVVAIFLAAHALVFFAARAIRPADVKSSFTGTRLNYLTLGLLVFVISTQIKH